jgi:integrase
MPTLTERFWSLVAVDDRIIDHFMGHQTEEMRRRYQHLFAEEKRTALNLLEY